MKNLQELINKKLEEFDAKLSGPIVVSWGMEECVCGKNDCICPKLVRDFISQAMREAAEGAVEAMDVESGYTVHEVHGDGGKTLNGESLYWAKVRKSKKKGEDYLKQ